MVEDQSVVGRRQIYYDQHGGETLICSDSEEEPEPEEEKREYSEGEDCIIWLVFQRGLLIRRANCGLNYIRLHSVRLFISSRSEITWFELNWQVDWAGVWHG